MSSNIDLSNQSCLPCQGGIAPLDEREAGAMLAHAPGWKLINAGKKLSRTFTFSDFMQAQAFAMRVGEASEGENHHPDISYGWGYCTVVFFTHKIGGLHENDFIMAAKVNALP
jgi:4a-hydroxytetrahydrobiopterin dehydratase